MWRSRQGSRASSRAMQTMRLEARVTYLTPKQVAGMLRVSEATVSRWAAQDATFPATRLPGRLVRIEEQALHRWLRRKSGRNATQVPDSLTPAPDERGQESVRREKCLSARHRGYSPNLKAPRLKAESFPAIVPISRIY